MKNKRPTIIDVAREAGVSYQTVSRVLNGQPRVAPETRERVLLAMKKLDFQQNLGAKMLKTQRSGTIQILSVDAEFPFEVPLLKTMHWGDYSVMYSDCSQKDLPKALDKAALHMVEGVFLYAPRLSIDDKKLLTLCRGIPIVRRDFVLESKLITWVGYDQIRATQLAVKHLIEMGHHEIAVVTGTLKTINAMWRYKIWKDTLSEHGLEPGPHAHGDYTTLKNAIETGYEGMSKILKSGAKFTAVLAANDYMAIGVLHALREHNLRIPEDVSVVSYDNSPLAAFQNPPLTTVDFNFDLQSRLAFQFLFELIENPNTPPHQHILLPSLIVRGSTRTL